MFRKNLSFLLCIITLLSVIVIVPTAASAAVDKSLSDTGASVSDLAETGWSIPSETTFASRIEQLKKKYPSYGYSGVYIEDGHAIAWQCYGYACLMLNEIFGIKYYADGFVNKADYTWGDLYAGDVVRIRGNTHSIFITKVTDKGYYFTDGNWDGANGVRWDAYYTKDEMKATFTYRIHVPGNTLLGTGTAKTGLYAAAPKLSSTKCTSTGVTVSWHAVDEASGYRVYFKDDKSKSWKSVGKTDKTSFHYTVDLEYGKEFWFTVRALDSYNELISSYDKEGISGTYLVAPPELKSVKAGVDKIKVTWDAVKGVNYYRLYVKADGAASWKIVANVKGTTYNYTGGKAHTSYKFTVRCLNDKKQLISGCSPKSLSADYITYATQLDTPTNIVAAATTTQGSIKVSWNAVKKATRYQVFYRRSTDTNWKKLAVTTKNYYHHTGCTNNTVYRYTVRCIDAKGAFMSDYKAGPNFHFFRYTEKLKAVKHDDNGNIKVSWTAVKGASSYILYYKTPSDSKWIKVITEKPITSTSYIFGSAESGVQYSFTVRACDSNGKIGSSYLASGVSLTYHSDRIANDSIVLSPLELTETDPEILTEKVESVSEAPDEIPTEPVVDPSLTDSTSNCTPAEPALLTEE